MITSLVLAAQFLMGIGKRLKADPYYRSLGVLTSIVVLIGTLFTWLVGSWPFRDAVFYAVTTMSMNTSYVGPQASASGSSMLYFHLVYTYLSVGMFIIFTLETGRTMLATYEKTREKMRARKAKKAAPRAQ